jgi:hypothetical protein
VMRLVKDRVPRGRPLKDGTISTVANVSADRQILGEIFVTSLSPTYKSDASATRVDIALLVSALFLQRFSLSFGHTVLGLDLPPIGLILLHQFLSGKVLIQRDRLLWFLGFALAITCSLLLNFKSTMLTGYFQTVVFFGLVTLSRPSTPDQYKRTLQAFQFLIMLLACVGVAQFVAQFVVDGRKLINFYGIVPDFLLDPRHDQATSGTGPRTFGNIIKSNGLFLGEPSAFSQITALGILIEVLEFRRPRYLLVMAAGFLVAYSGTGLMLLLLFLPLAGLRHGKAGLSALLVVIFVAGLAATGIIDLSVFTSRVGEFQDTHSSGFERFVAPFWQASKQFDTASLQALLVGSGPGTIKNAGDLSYATSVVNWFKLFYEYGIFGSFTFGLFLASCFRRSRCHGLVIAALIMNYLFEQGTFAIAIVLCTLSGPEPRRRHINSSSQYEPSLVAGSAAG